MSDIKHYSFLRDAEVTERDVVIIPFGDSAVVVDHKGRYIVLAGAAPLAPEFEEDEEGKIEYGHYRGAVVRKGALGVALSNIAQTSFRRADD